MANDTPPPMPEPGEGPQEFGRGFVLAVGVACASVAVLLTLLAVFIYSRFCTGRHRAQNGCLCSGSIPVLNCQLSHLAALPFQGQQVRRCGCSQLAHPPSYHSFGDNLDEGVEHVSRRSVSQHDLTSPEQPLNPAALSHRGSDGQFLPSATFYGASQNSTAVPMSGSCAAHSTYTPCTPRRDAHRQRRPCYPAERQDDASHTEAPSVPSSTATVFSLGHSQQSDTRSFFTQRTPIGDSTRHDSPRQPRIIQAQSHTPQVQSHTVQEYSRETQTQVQTQGIQNHAPQATVDNPHIQSHASQAPIVNPQTQTHAPQTQTHAPQIQSHAPQIQSHVAQTPFDAPQLERYATDPTQTQNYRSRLWNNSRSEEVSTAQPGNSVIRMSGDHVNERALQNPAAASSSTRGLVAVTERSVGNEDDGMAQRLERPVDDVSSATRSVDVLSPRVFSSHVVVLPRIDSVNQSNERDEMIELRPRPHLNLPENNGGTAQTTCFDARDAVATENSCVNQSRLPPSADSGYLPAVSSPGYEISPMPSVLNSAPTLNPNSLEGITDLPERRWEECEDSSEEAHHQTLRKRTSTDDVFQRLGTCTGDPNYLEQSNEKLKRDKQLGSLIRPESRAHASERECADDSPLHLSQEDLLLFRNPPEDVLRTLYTPTQCSRTSIVQGKLLVHIAKTIDSRGGELYLDKMGIRLRVPPLAILPGRRQLICLVLNWDLSDNPGMLRQEALVSPVIFCGPHGLTFDKPCTISFKHCAFDSRFAEIRCSDTDLFDSKEWSKMPAVVQSQGRGEKGQDDASERQQGDDQKNGDVETEETTSKVQRAQYFTSDECQVSTRHFSLFTCIQRSSTTKLKKWLQVAVFTRELHPKCQHHEIRVYFLNRTPCALQWAIQNEASHDFRLACPVMNFLFEEIGESMMVQVAYLSEGWAMVSDTVGHSVLREVAFENIWHGTCPHAPLCFRRSNQLSEGPGPTQVNPSLGQVTPGSRAALTKSTSDSVSSTSAVFDQTGDRGGTGTGVVGCSPDAEFEHREKRSADIEEARAPRVVLSNMEGSDKSVLNGRENVDQQKGKGKRSRKETSPYVNVDIQYNRDHAESSRRASQSSRSEFESLLMTSRECNNDVDDDDEEPPGSGREHDQRKEREINIDLRLYQQLCNNKSAHVNVLLFHTAGHQLGISVPKSAVL